ncbi:unnamed protein product [Prorocentrum cordatum]|uniref:Uncharacterized protein n=1 Tax=Prorocentrum cordatum TaxID=2364126 RepID=A0ABN9UL53_9DINO|nr:unnamed protein product [Polarella glacialis]
MAVAEDAWGVSTLAAETEVLRARYEEQAGSARPSARLQFEYACLLACSPRRAEVAEGARLLDELLEAGFSREEVLHRLALAHLRRGPQDPLLVGRRGRELPRRFFSGGRAEHPRAARAASAPEGFAVHLLKLWVWQSYGQGLARGW